MSHLEWQRMPKGLVKVSSTAMWRASFAHISPLVEAATYVSHGSREPSNIVDKLQNVWFLRDYVDSCGGRVCV
jgi:hypothetical protein